MTVMNGRRILRAQFMEVLVVVVVIACIVICAWGNEKGEERRRMRAFIPYNQDGTLQDQSNTILSRKLEGGDNDNHEHYKDALFPLDSNDKLGLLVVNVAVMIAAAGGIGGGGMLVPIYILIMKFHTKMAIPLSNITVLGGALANFIFNVKERHPLADRPQVDWDLILMMEPLTIGGTLIGALVNKVIPEDYLTVLMVCLLAVVAKRTISMGFKEYLIETEQNTGKCAHDESNSISLPGPGYKSSSDLNGEDDEVPLLEKHETTIEIPNLSSTDEDGRRQNGGMGKDEGAKRGYDDDDDTASKLPKSVLRRILDEERHTPWRKVGFLLMVFFVVLVINILKGGGNAKSIIGVRCGSVTFWLMNFLALLWLFSVTVFYGRYLYKRWKLKEKVGYRYVKGDVEWDFVSTMKYPFICGFAGVGAGLFGIGGGIVKGPLMLEMGMLPSVVSATSATMILFTSVTAATSFILFGLLPFDYGVVLLVCGFISTFAGQVVVHYLVQKFNRPSLIILSIGLAVAVSCAMMGGKGLHNYATRGPAAHTHVASIC